MTIQRELVRLVAATVLPAGIAAELLIAYSYERQRTIIEQRTLETARALMQAVDRELAGGRPRCRRWPGPITWQRATLPRSIGRPERSSRICRATCLPSPIARARLLSTRRGHSALRSRSRTPAFREPARNLITQAEKPLQHSARYSVYPNARRGPSAATRHPQLDTAQHWSALAPDWIPKGLCSG